MSFTSTTPANYSGGYRTGVVSLTATINTSYTSYTSGVIPFAVPVWVELTDESGWSYWLDDDFVPGYWCSTKARVSKFYRAN
jgi:hypothetical protein